MNLKILAFLFFSYLYTYGQDNKAQHIQLLLEYIQQEETDSEVLVNLWWHYLEQPVQVKKIDKNFLEELIFLNPIEIKQILIFCKENQPILHVHELQYVSNLSEQSFLRLRPFIYVPQKAKQLSTKNKQEILVRFAQNFNNEEEIKQAEKLYTHFRAQRKWYRFGFLAEKDAGENLPHKGGFDFHSAQLYFQHPKKDFQLALGDYHIKMGQGLMLYQGYANGVGANINSIKRQDFRLKPYTGTNENDFFRGIAASWKHKKMRYSTFYSNRQRDARIYNENGQNYFINFNNSGLHASDTDLEKKDRVKEINYGVSLRWSSQKTTLGWHYMRSNYDAMQRKEEDTYAIIGDRFQNTAFDFSFDIKNHHFFGEWSSDLNKQAFLIASLSPLSDKLALAFLFSKNENGFHAPYAQLFNGQNAGAHNFYVGLTYDYSPKLHFSFYHTRNSIGTNNTTQLLFPDNHKAFAQISYKVRRGPSTYLQYQSSVKQNATEGSNNNTISNQSTQTKIRWHSEIPFSENWKFRWRIEYQHYKDEIDLHEDAWMIYQELKYKPLKSKLSLVLRYVLFDTTFETRIYAYEQQVRYQYASAQFYGQGEQIYLLTHYKINKHYECWLRYAHYHFLRKEEQMTQDQLTVQLRISF